jgi:hypothetical protein
VSGSSLGGTYVPGYELLKGTFFGQNRRQDAGAKALVFIDS